ncbi:hypothetical protein [Allosphingosinicella indica]|uniref:2'-hydroxyisoflavone reductase n=1 Tax=Allosphingosinicella indica TaxID=941907 RepID=A0A1X7FYT2_9SPHN|nr:hypothetical protein [Allosphingosinicella indica]SMF61255.1 2'-hydroxyisoflavone reductase [Allosphingosinicella indica]
MLATRRTILGGAAMLAGAATAPATAARAVAESETSGRPLRILVLGGTRYLGPAVVTAAAARGHEITLFNRGVTQPWLFPGVEKLKGDRYPDIGVGLAPLGQREWDVAIDLSGQYPRVVEASASRLADRVGHYVYVSSISAYRSFATPDVDESAPLRALRREYVESPDLVEGDWPTYGARKALSEAAVARHFPGRHTILRPGPICGGANNDGSGAYWAERLYRGGTVLVPGDGSDRVQLIDVGDTGDFTVLAAERRLPGAYNLVGPAEPIDARAYLAACARAVGREAELVFAGDFPDGINSMPMIPPYRHVPGHATMRNQRALAAGLRLRPIEETIRDNWIDHRLRRGKVYDYAAAGIGVTAAREAEMIAALR